MDVECRDNPSIWQYSVNCIKVGREFTEYNTDWTVLTVPSINLPVSVL